MIMNIKLYSGSLPTRFSTIKSLFSMQFDKNNLLYPYEIDKANYLPDNILNLTDISSLNYGIEARVPFLSNDLIYYSSYNRNEILDDKPKKYLFEMIANILPSVDFNLVKKDGFAQTHNKNSTFLKRLFLTRKFKSRNRDITLSKLREIISYQWLKLND